MKFFFNITLTLISSCLSVNWAYPCDAQDIPEPSRPLSDLCSKHHIPLPKNAYPKNAYSVLEILAEVVEMNDPLIFSQEDLYSMMADIQHVYEYDLYLQHPLISEHFQYYISVLTNLDNVLECHLEEHHNDISSPIPNGNSNYLWNVNSFYTLTLSKTKTFIETKVTAMKLQGFNL